MLEYRDFTSNATSNALSGMRVSSIILQKCPLSLTKLGKVGTIRCSLSIRRSFQPDFDALPVVLSPKRVAVNIANGEFSDNNTDDAVVELITVEPLYCGHHRAKFSGLNKEVAV